MGITSFNRRRRAAASPEGTEEVLTGGEGTQTDEAHLVYEQALEAYRLEVERVEHTIDEAQARIDAVLLANGAEHEAAREDELSLEAVEELAAARKQLADTEAEQDALVKPENPAKEPATDELPDASDGVAVWRAYAHSIGKGSEEELSKLDKRAVRKLVEAPAA